jgi:hypothetical protein
MQESALVSILREVCEFMEHLAEITIRSAASRSRPTNVSGTTRRVLVFPAQLGHARPLTRLGTSLLRAVLAGALLVLGLLVWLISKALLSEVHFTWIVISSLPIGAVAMLVGTAFLVHRRKWRRKKSREMLE